jgi:hypothetical protein
LLVVLLLAVSAGIAAASSSTKNIDCNPSPADDDLVLPMPGGLSMVFRPVFLGTGNAPYGLKRVTLGGDGENFKEHPTAVAIGGAFIAPRNGRPDWLYYIGKYEVTEAQYTAVVGVQARDQKRSGNWSGITPAVNLSHQEVESFIDRYNQWLYANALDRIPKNDGAPGFVRLPTESEWEFAARGGSQVSDDQFDRRLPYDGSLAEYEWFAGPTSAHNKLQPIGKLKPNPLLLYDMLGNAAEMTSSLYQLEYYQGRIGGFVARGGSFMTNESEMRASQRSEQPFYAVRNQNGPPLPYRRDDMGFRLVLSSLVIPTTHASQVLSNAWNDYRQGAGAKNPAALSTSSDDTRVNAQKDDAAVHLERLKQALSGRGQLSGEAAEEVKLIEATLSDIVAARRQAARDSAFAWTKIAAERALTIVLTLQKIPTQNLVIQNVEDRLSGGELNPEEQQGDAKRLENYRRQLRELEETVAMASEAYSDAQRQLARISPELIAEGFNDYRRRLTDNRAAPLQLKVVDEAARQNNGLRDSGRVDSSGWREAFEAMSKSVTP